MQCRMMPLVSLCHNIKKDDIKVVIAVGEPTVRKNSMIEWQRMV